MSKVYLQHGVNSDIDRIRILGSTKTMLPSGLPCATMDRTDDGARRRQPDRMPREFGREREIQLPKSDFSHHRPFVRSHSLSTPLRVPRSLPSTASCVVKLAAHSHGWDRPRFAWLLGPAGGRFGILGASPPPFSRFRAGDNADGLTATFQSADHP